MLKGIICTLLSINPHQMKNFFALILILQICICVSAQDITIGKQEVIHSDILNEDRNIWIGLPEGYSEANQYPVFYLLDGPGHFQHTTGSAKFLQNNQRAPGCIVVGISNTDRTRDLTPPAITDNLNDDDGIPFDYTQAGGADNFLSFMEKELMPYIESNYSTADYKILIGHSLGGLFAVHALLVEPDLFDGYIAISPSLWFDQQSFLLKAEKVLRENENLNSSFYMTMGNEGGEMLGGAMKLAALMEEHADNMHWKFQRMPAETHGTVPHRSTYDGMEFLFSDWEPPLPSTFKEFEAMMAAGTIEDVVENIQSHYAGLSDKYGFPVSEEATINELGYILIQEEKFDEAVYVMTSNTINHPESANAFDSLGDAYRAKGKVDNARSSYQKAIELSEKHNHPVGEVSKQKMEGLEKE
jgi:predicted alpha/beta superfamily hydrolase